MEPKKNPSSDIYAQRPLHFSISLVISLLLIITAFEWKFHIPDHKTKTWVIQEPEEILDIPVTDQPPPPPPKIQLPRIVEIPNEEEVFEAVKIDFEMDMGNEPQPAELPVPVVESIDEEDTPDQIFLFVESPPVFKGGEVALLKFITKNLNYPARARRMGIEGKVFVKAIIEKDGSVSDAEVIKGIGGGCDEEALRVIRMLPKYEPGKQRGRPVRVTITYPITFVMQ
jgi:periplasmic protein TonB